MSDNPFFKAWTAPFELPPFSAIKPEHYPEAFDKGMAEHRAEIAAISSDPQAPTFANTIEALERAGEPLRKVSSVFWNLSSADTNDALQAIERDMAPKLAAHGSAIYLDAALFQRVDALYAARDTLGLSDEQKRVLELTHKDFVRAGARLQGADKERMAAIVARLAELTTTFGQNVLKDEAAFTLPLDSKDDLAGLSPSLIDSVANAAKDRHIDAPYAVTLSRSHVEPFLETSARRDLRETVFKAFVARGANGGATDNHAVVEEIVKLRAERAKLLGYETFAHFKLDNTMAETPEAVKGLLDRVWEKGRARALEERDDMQKIADAEGANFAIAAHDWRYYSQKLRKAKFDVDEARVKPYFELNKMREAAFYTANRLFGLSFEERKGLDLYHPDVRAFDVTDRDGRHVALFLADDFARASKRSGAWMTSFRDQQKLDGVVRPIIVNVLNVAKPGAGQPVLLSIDEARTLFHEFGHALHGMLSDVIYPRISGTSVASDFVELPSQLYEHWVLQKDILQKFARHHQTGDEIPADILERIRAMQTFNQGFATVEYCSSAYIDMDFHMLPAPAVVDAKKFQRDQLAAIRMPDEISMRHRTPHFAHVFAGEGYAAGYYSYLWSEVLDADAFDAFQETGDIFNPDVAARLREFIYSAGGRREPADAYIAFRGRVPTPDALMRKRGLA